MLAQGLRFAPATRHGEAAYRAFFDALAAPQFQRSIAGSVESVGQ